MFILKNFVEMPKEKLSSDVLLQLLYTESWFSCLLLSSLILISSKGKKNKKHWSSQIQANDLAVIACLCPEPQCKHRKFLFISL